MFNFYGEKLSVVNNFSLVLVDDCFQDFIVVVGIILIDLVLQRLFGYFQEIFFDLYYVNLYKEVIRNGKINNILKYDYIKVIDKFGFI